MRHLRRRHSFALIALLAPAIGCAKGNSGSPGTGGSSQGGTGMVGGGGTGGGADDPFAGLPASKALHVEGNAMKDASGTAVRLLGVNRAGTEYMCATATSSATFDGSTGPNSISALLTWNINAVRLPLNESCWLGINGAHVTGDEYQAAIIDYAVRLHQKGLYVVLDLHWSAPGTTLATKQSTMAYASHAIDFWTSVATTFKNDPMVLFDLFNEPILDASDGTNGPVGDANAAWNCWLNGCSVGSGMLVGMQAMLNAVRATGATQIVVAGGIDWAHRMDQWLQHKPTDSTGNLIAGFHLYDQSRSSCYDMNCWNNMGLATVASNVPVLTGELGETDCAHGVIDSFMNWADPKGISYLGWAWNPQSCGSFPALITNVDGTPTAFGQGLKDHLATMPALH